MTISQPRRYLDDTRRQEDVPEPESIVIKLFPWADNHRYRGILLSDLPAPTR